MAQAEQSPSTNPPPPLWATLAQEACRLASQAAVAPSYAERKRLTEEALAAWRLARRVRQASSHN
jgi:hypothetical protein